VASDACFVLRDERAFCVSEGDLPRKGGEKMIFVSLVKAAPGKAKQAAESLKAASSLPGGCKLVSCYVTYGRYDAVCVWEAPDVTAANRCVTALVATGLVSTETMLAQAPDDFLA